MNNLHAPTVPSGPTSSAAATNGVAGHLSFAELQRKKDDIEAELKALGGVLDSVRLHTHTPGPFAFYDTLTNACEAWCQHGDSPPYEGRLPSRRH